MKYSILICLSVIVTSSALAAPPTAPQNFSRSNHPLLSDLGLNDAQRTKLKALREKYGSPREHAVTMAKMREELIALLRNPQSTDAQIREYSKKMGAESTALNKKRVDKLLELRKILTPQQFAQLIERMQARRKAAPARKDIIGQIGEGASTTNGPEKAPQHSAEMEPRQDPDTELENGLF